MHFWLHYRCLYGIFPQGVGGSVQLPRGYLKKVYQTIRDKGGVCISDEVSTTTISVSIHKYAVYLYTVATVIIVYHNSIYIPSYLVFVTMDN